MNRSKQKQRRHQEPIKPRVCSSEYKDTHVFWNFSHTWPKHLFLHKLPVEQGCEGKSGGTVEKRLCSVNTKCKHNDMLTLNMLIQRCVRLLWSFHGLQTFARSNQRCSLPYTAKPLNQQINRSSCSRLRTSWYRVSHHKQTAPN